MCVAVHTPSPDGPSVQRTCRVRDSGPPALRPVKGKAWLLPRLPRALLAVAFLMTIAVGSLPADQPAAPTRTEPPQPAAQAEPATETPPQAEQSDLDAELDALIAELDPPSLEEILEWFEPIPTVEEVLAPLNDDPDAPFRRVLSESDEQRVRELEELADQAAGRLNHEQAIAFAKEVVAIRCAEQGANHWQSVEAQRMLQDFERIAALPVRIRSRLGLPAEDTSAFVVANPAQPTPELALRRPAVGGSVLPDPREDVLRTLFQEQRGKPGAQQAPADEPFQSTPRELQELPRPGSVPAKPAGCKLTNRLGGVVATIHARMSSFIGVGGV